MLSYMSVRMHAAKGVYEHALTYNTKRVDIRWLPHNVGDENFRGCVGNGAQGTALADWGLAVVDRSAQPKIRYLQQHSFSNSSRNSSHSL